MSALQQDSAGCQKGPQRRLVPLAVSPQTLPPIAVETTRPHDHQQETMLWEFCLAPKVVEPPLFSAANTANRCSPVKEGHGLVMLPLTKLDDELMGFVPSIYRQLPTVAVATGVANKPREAVLPFGALAKEFVTEVDDIRLVALAAHHAKNLARSIAQVAAVQMFMAGTVDVGGSSGGGAQPRASASSPKYSITSSFPRKKCATTRPQSASSIGPSTRNSFR